MPSLEELFRQEADTCLRTLTDGILRLENLPDPQPDDIAPLMRAAHSLKGAARIIHLEPAVHIAHALEDLLEATRLRQIPPPTPATIDTLLHATDTLRALTSLPPEQWKTREAELHQASLATIAALTAARTSAPAEPPATPATPAPSFDETLLDLYQQESATHCHTLARLLNLPAPEILLPQNLEELHRAAHSLKGAARIIRIEPIAALAHTLETLAHTWQTGADTPPDPLPPHFQQAVALLHHLGQLPAPSLATELTHHTPRLATLARDLAHPRDLPPEPASAPVPPAQPLPAPAQPSPPGPSDRILRITADTVNRLLGLAGESLVESRWLPPFANSLLRHRRQHSLLLQDTDRLRHSIQQSNPAHTLALLHDHHQRLLHLHQNLVHLLEDLDRHERRATSLAHRLHREAINCRLRPLSDALAPFPRMIRDLARATGKQATLTITGENSPVDRDILEKLDAPLTHLLRNALDHGIETPEERIAARKPPAGLIRIDARHTSGTLTLSISDDGRGIDLDHLRATIIRRNLTTPDIAPTLSETELLQFLLLPGFTLKDTVTELSGRGVGLDIVHTLAREARGTLRILRRPGAGATFQLELPVTLSVIRALLIEVDGEPYALPLSRVQRAIKVPRHQIRSLEGKNHLPQAHGPPIGLLPARQLLALPPRTTPAEDPLHILIIGDAHNRHGLIVDNFLGERQLVLQPLDPRLGKVQDLSAAALMDNGAPLLILDVDDLLRSAEKLAATGAITPLRATQTATAAAPAKTILVVDDSLTVRELQRKLLTTRGYNVDTAVDGLDGWNTLRTGDYALVITDVDMPRLDGIELVSLIKKDPRRQNTPVLIVSYKDRDDDRRRGLDAGADYYLTKGSFHDETLLNAVTDLIGPPLET